MAGHSSRSAKQNIASTTASSAPSPATSAGTENSVALDEMPATDGGDTSTPLLDEAADRRRPYLNADAYNACSPANIGALVRDTVQAWNSSLKDGDGVGTYDALYIAVETMMKQGVGLSTVSSNIRQLFYGDKAAEHGTNYSMVTYRKGAVTVHFRNQIEPLVITAPSAFTGLDTNKRESKVEAMTDVYTNEGGDFLGTDETFMAQHAVMRDLFAQDPNNRQHAALPRNGAGFREVYYDWLVAVAVPTYMLAAEAFVLGKLGDVTGQDAQKVLERVLELAMEFAEPGVGARAHDTLEIQDEAVAHVVMKKLGYDINVDTDAVGQSMIRSAGG